jgi:DNA-binding transcriptional LysR family regulator
MDIDRVRYFQVFSETGSLVRASEILHISQPALSKALRLLEKEVHLKLLESDGRGLKLTRQGEEFKKLSAPLLKQWMDLSKSVISSQDIQPTRIGSFEVFTTYFLRHLTSFIKLEALELHELTPGKLEEAIMSDRVDIGITYNPIPKKGVDFVEVGKIRMGIYGLKSFEDKDWASLPFVIPLNPGEGTPSKVMGLDGWPEHRYERIIHYKVGMMESAMELMRQGVCVGYMPSFIIEIHNQIVIPSLRLMELDCPVPVKERKQSVFLVQKSGRSESPLYRNIAKCLRNLS